MAYLISVAQSKRLEDLFDIRAKGNEIQSQKGNTPPLTWRESQLRVLIASISQKPIYENAELNTKGNSLVLLVCTF